MLEIKKDNLEKIFTGKPIYKGDLIKKENYESGKIACVFCEEKFIGMYKVINNEDIFAKSEFVMQPIGEKK